ncbi:MAG: signal peptide peptidase SppA [Candidatus Tisiphia sp.]|nr:signal peptide peptidase SppA [Candidatus Tisiphia sp.]
MTITAEYLIERKQNKTKLMLWKLATIFMFIVLIVVMIKQFDLTKSEYITTNSKYIAAISIEDIIFEDAKRDTRLEKIIDDDQISALVVNVNSPGGTVVGSEKIYNILRKISVKKPVVVVMGTLAASGGYLISLGGDYIISHNGTITGSIGVILQTLEVTDLAKTLGITFNNFKSGELKAVPNPTEKVTEAVRQAIMSNVLDTYDYFIELVALRRNIPIDQVRELADGRIYSGRQALKLKLVDAVGSQDDAIKWLQEVKKIDKDLKVKEFKIKPKPKFLEIIMEDFDSILPSFFKNKFQGLGAIF